MEIGWTRCGTPMDTEHRDKDTPHPPRYAIGHIVRVPFPNWLSLAITYLAMSHNELPIIKHQLSSG